MESVYVELALVAVGAMLSPTTLSFSIFALILGERPLRTGFWFLLGAFTVTILIGVVAAFVLGNAAATPNSSTPKTWVAVLDLVAGVLIVFFVVRLLRRPLDPQKMAATMEKMSTVASSPVIAVVAAGATLANPGAFIPLALKDISETNPNAAQYVALWLAFTVVALLPLTLAVIMLAVAPDPTQRVLHRARAWLERNVRTVAAVILLLIAASLLRGAIAGLTA